MEFPGGGNQDIEFGIVEPLEQIIKFKHRMDTLNILEIKKLKLSL
jgi:hypothetical protein